MENERIKRYLLVLFKDGGFLTQGYTYLPQTGVRKSTVFTLFTVLEDEHKTIDDVLFYFSSKSPIQFMGEGSKQTDIREFVNMIEGRK